jgi:phosphopantothenoylcysteine synthetase/decarboxylase
VINPEVIYLIISGSEAARQVPQLLAELTTFERPLYTLLTENAASVISPLHLAEQPGHHLIDSYFDPALLPDRKPGLVLVAPATFNTVNKISQGIADTLAHSLVAEAIGAGWPVVIAPAVNAALANHPQFALSWQTLAHWGVTLVPTRSDGATLKMAAVSSIVAAVQAVFETNPTGYPENENKPEIS